MNATILPVSEVHAHAARIDLALRVGLRYREAAVVVSSHGGDVRFEIRARPGCTPISATVQLDAAGRAMAPRQHTDARFAAAMFAAVLPHAVGTETRPAVLALAQAHSAARRHDQARALFAACGIGYVIA